jgi:RNA polymerase sigma factor (sigma-70 family)
MVMTDKWILHSDRSLVLACRQGEADAWEVLVNRYQRLIFTIPLRAGLDEDRAAEVFQHTFAALLKHLDRIEQPERVRAWLVTTARRESLRIASQLKAELTFSDTDEANGQASYEDVPGDELLPGEELERIEEQHLIRAAIANLDERCRRLLTMLFYLPDPPPYGEIAAALGMPEGSLGPTRARCLQKMRRRLEDSGFYS